jgi:Protein of unknown function (DUF3306)
MSQTEDFLSRWSRLKGLSGVEEGGVGEKGDAPRAAEVSTPAAFDPASLPPIESIVADSDIRPFLEPLVPAELTLAALRRAWNTDPTIRDFVGIADNQWDFNDQTAIPGFGPLRAADGARNPPVQAGISNSAADEAGEGSRIVEQPESMSIDPQYDNPGHEVSRVPTAPAHGSHDANLDGRLVEVSDAASVTQSGAAEAIPGPRPIRSHGGALPR